jgi:ATP-binding cassette subfamily B protein
VSAVLQESVLFAATIRENIAYGALDAEMPAIEAAARLANIHEFIAGLPDGYETMVGERGATLSGGQRQRIAIARAAIRNAPILVFDEPTSGLDEANERVVTDALEQLASGRTTIWITHDLQTAARADRILHIEHGRLLEQGTHGELMRAGGRYAGLFAHPAGTVAQAEEECDAVGYR